MLTGCVNLSLRERLIPKSEAGAQFSGTARPEADGKRARKKIGESETDDLERPDRRKRGRNSVYTFSKFPRPYSRSFCWAPKLLRHQHSSSIYVFLWISQDEASSARARQDKTSRPFDLEHHFQSEHVQVRM